MIDSNLSGLQRSYYLCDYQDHPKPYITQVLRALAFLTDLEKAKACRPSS